MFQMELDHLLFYFIFSEIEKLATIKTKIVTRFGQPIKKCSVGSLLQLVEEIELLTLVSGLPILFILPAGTNMW